MKADLTTSLEALIIVPEPAPADEPLFDLFDLEDPPSRVFEKRPIGDDATPEQ